MTRTGNSVTIYTQPNCQQCVAAKRFLDAAGVKYEPIDVSENETALAYVRELGYQAVPVIVYGDDHFYGFNPGRLGALL